MAVDNDTGMGTPANLTHFIKCSDLEGDDFSFYGSNFCLGPDFQPYRCGRDVLNIQRSADSGLGIPKAVSNGFTGGAFHQRNHAGCGIDQQITGANFLGGVLPLCQRADFPF